MSEHSKYSRIVGSDGKTHYYLVPVHEFQQLISQQLDSDEYTIPHEVVKMHLLDEISLIAAWRIHLGLTQEEVGRRIGVSQSAYAQMEWAKKPRIETRRRIAQALGIDVHQLSL